MRNSVADVMALVASNVRPLLVLVVVFIYIAIAVLPGPRRALTGAELPILMGVGTALVAIGLCHPKRGRYFAGVLAGAIAFAIPARGPLPGLSGGWPTELLFPVGWILLGASVWSWRAAAASYVVGGLWTLLLLAAPEGVMYFGGPLHDADQLFWEVLVPIALWPYLTFGMLGVFGLRFM